MRECRRPRINFRFPSTMSPLSVIYRRKQSHAVYVASKAFKKFIGLPLRSAA